MHPGTLVLILLGLVTVAIVVSIIYVPKARKFVLELLLAIAAAYAISYYTLKPTSSPGRQADPKAKQLESTVLEECSRLTKDETTLSVPVACTKQ